MKTKISILIGAVAIVTLSFTFASSPSPSTELPETGSSSGDSAPVGGFISDQIVK